MLDEHPLTTLDIKCTKPKYWTKAIALRAGHFKFNDDLTNCFKENGDILSLLQRIRSYKLSYEEFDAQTLIASRKYTLIDKRKFSNWLSEARLFYKFILNKEQ